MLLFFLLCVINYACAQQNLQVNTTQGIVQGYSATDGNYFTFYGIHYGGSVSNENRFKGPAPAPTYPGIFEARESQVICAQPSARGLIGQEDCLTLNIFTSGATPAKPVLVWLTGEEYVKTDNILSSFRELVQEGTVVVQVNYRLSIFGFLCLGVSDAPGNAGLRDVVQALKWIKHNIAGFGGDANNVILFGHGSGAAMVDLITLSPASKDLVHKAIAQSGSALAPWAISYEPVLHAQALGAKLGYSDKNNAELAKLLANTELYVLQSALNDFEFKNNSILFAPCIENFNLNPNDTFLHDAPLNILRSGNYNHVPYIAGYTDREGSMRAEEAIVKQWLQKIATNFTEFVQVDLDFGSNSANVERTIRELYFGTQTVTAVDMEQFLNYQGDTLVLIHVIRGAKERANTSTAPVRLYEFAYRGTQNSDWVFDKVPLNGAKHGAVLNYLLNYDLKPVTDDGVRLSLLRRFVGFFNNGDPIQSIQPGPVWQFVHPNFLHYLEYSGSDVTGFKETANVGPHAEKMDFWGDLYSKYYKVPLPVSSGLTVVGSSIVLFSILFNLFY